MIIVHVGTFVRRVVLVIIRNIVEVEVKIAPALIIDAHYPVGQLCFEPPRHNVLATKGHVEGQVALRASSSIRCCSTIVGIDWPLSASLGLPRRVYEE